MIEWLQNADCELSREVFIALRAVPWIFGMFAIAGAFRMSGTTPAELIRALRGG